MTGPLSRSAAVTNASESRRGRARHPRVLFVGPLPPPLGGVQLVIEMTLKSSLAQDYEIRTVNTSKDVLRWAVERATWRTIPYFIRDLWRLVSTLLRWPPDVVIVHAAQNYAIMRDWVMMLVPRLLGRKVICHYHGTLHTVFPSPRTAFGRLAGRFIMAPAHRIIVLGPTYRDQFARAWRRGNDVTWAPNFAEVHLFDAAASVTNTGSFPWLAPGERGILFVGRLSRPKGIWDLLDAIPAVLAQHPQARFLLCGVAENLALEANLRDEITKRGINERVTLLGPREGRDKIDVWLSASVFVSPSLTEAFPLVIPEAMAAGVPMVVTDVGAIPDFVKDGEDGFLIKPHDPRALAEKVNILLLEEPLRARIARHVHERATREFSVEVHVAVLRTIIRDVLEPSRV